MPELKFALSRGFAVGGLCLGVVTRGGALPDGLHRGHQRSAPGYHILPLSGLSVSGFARIGKWARIRQRTHAYKLFLSFLLKCGTVKPLSKVATTLTFWGARGSIPTPGPGTVRYGGNTSCVEVRSGGEIIILDAGTGLRGLGNALAKEFKKRPVHLTMLITHTHWDHIQGLPFFAPIYNPHCRLRLVCSEGARTGLINALTGQMESTYFPVPFSELPSNIEIEELKNFSFTVGPLSIRTLRANHPGNCVGYRLLAPDCLITFFPDTEPRAGKDVEMIDFVRESDALILDSQYTAAEYKQHLGWGHGCVDDSAALAIAANVKKLFLFHHDPDRDDKQLDELLRHARRLTAAGKSKLKVDLAREGMSIQLP